MGILSGLAGMAGSLFGGASRQGSGGGRSPIGQTGEQRVGTVISGGNQSTPAFLSGGGNGTPWPVVAMVLAALVALVFVLSD